MARLIVRIDGEETTLDLKFGESVSVGRDPSNTIALSDEKKASRRHCQVTPVKRDGVEAWELNDLGATNKTRVNGKPTDRRILTTGDVIQVGKTEIAFEDETELERMREAGSQGVCYLEWLSGDKKGQKVYLDQARVTLGRRDSNTIPLGDRMSSGHHAEITKDLNGYTARDLGSTNGTLVNGEPMTEAVLAHGTRLRIGNSHFVFKDPSMKDIEIELSQVEEDDGWGMMGDIDLTKARGSYAGLLIGFAILALAGVGGWYITQQAEQASQNDTVDITNKIDNGDMEDADFLSWESEVDREDISVKSQSKGRKGKGLAIAHNGGAETGPALVLYGDQFEGLVTKPFRLKADFRAKGGDGAARLVALWRGTGRSARQAIVLARASGSWTPVDVELPKPGWAQFLQIGVHVMPGGGALLDNVRLTNDKPGEAPTSITCPGNLSAHLDGAGGLTMTSGTATAVALGLGPTAQVGGKWLVDFVAKGAPSGDSLQGSFVDGEEAVPASITWSSTADGVEAAIECAGAERVGLRGGLTRSFIGDRLNILTKGRPRTMPAAAGRKAESVEKVLTGRPEASTGLLTFVVRDAAGMFEISEALDPSVLDVTTSVAGANATIAIVADYKQQRQAAQEALAAARGKLQAVPGEGIEALRAVALAYPFDEGVRDQATSLAATAEQQALADIQELETSLANFEIYQSPDALDNMERRLAALQAAFPERAGEGGSLETAVASLGARAKQASDQWYETFADAELTRLSNLADMLTKDGENDEYQPMAALYLRAIESRFGHLASEATAFGRRVLAARKKLAALEASETVKQAVPPPAGN